ncbi:MAG: AMIN domain-containing protein [Gemmatimonadota bacterium]|nr:AMIN domain-containing protein [Gemmatimonadota bacterium]
MRRVWLLAGLTAVALSAGLSSSATVARAAAVAPRTGKSANGEVTALSVIPSTGKAEVVIAIGGAVDVSDFSLSSPARVVLDLRGAKLTLPARMYDRVRRGSITNVRVAQYTDDVVRVVIDMDQRHEYTVTRSAGEVRIAVDGLGEKFDPWHNTPELASPSEPRSAAAIARAETRRQEAHNEAPIFKKTGTKRPSEAPVEPRITVTYQDADIKEVIAAFAVFSSRTIVVGKGVTGTVSAEVRDQPWDVALRAILTSQGLAAVEDADGIITVDSYENIASKQATEPLQTRIIAINYARAFSLVQTITGLLSKDCGLRAGTNAQAAGACTTRGAVAADTTTNRLIITDVPSRLEDIANYIRDLDLRTPQVAIKAKIIFVNRTNIEDLGLAYDLGSRNTFFNKIVQRTDPSTFVPIDSNGDGVPDALGGGTQFNSSQTNIQLGGNSLAAIANANQRVVGPALSLVFSTVLGHFSLTSFIDALQEVRLADIQAEPSIVTLDNREATILSGEETPIRIIDLGTQAQGGQQQAPRATVSFKQTGISLTVRPHVTNNRMIQMTLHAERSNLQAAASDLGFTFATQKSDNQLLVADGETAVIGGLTVTQVTSSKAGIPLLVDLPLIGRLFGETRVQEDKRDLLILVTPHIVDEGEKIGSPDGVK